MSSNKLVSGLCYLSILFAPILFPLIVWIVSTEEEVTSNAKKALWLHVLPFLLTIVGLFVLFFFGIATTSEEFLTGTALMIVILIGIFDFFLFFWNIVKSIKIFLS